jgi:hypothetical protein
MQHPEDDPQDNGQGRHITRHSDLDGSIIVVLYLVILLACMCRLERLIRPLFPEPPPPPH